MLITKNLQVWAAKITLNSTITGMTTKRRLIPHSPVRAYFYLATWLLLGDCYTRQCKGLTFPMALRYLAMASWISLATVSSPLPHGTTTRTWSKQTVTFMAGSWTDIVHLLISILRSFQTYEHQNRQWSETISGSNRTQRDRLSVTTREETTRHRFMWTSSFL